MKIKILCVGKIKEAFFTDAIKEYSKRMQKFCDFEICEVPDEMTPQTYSETERLNIIDKEASRLEKYIQPQDYLIGLFISGKKLTSEKFAETISNIFVNGNSSIAFVIGGSLGLSPKIESRCNYKLSFSDFTFPHQLMRVILCEQIYRAFKINANEPYHK